MSVWNDLIETYDNNIIKSESQNNPSILKRLIPIAHICQVVKFEVVIHANGKIESARSLSKEEQMTVIPCSIESSNRTSTQIAPHFLVDKLKYIAKDAKHYEEKDPNYIEHYHNVYMDQLNNWTNSIYSHSKICAVEKCLQETDLCKFLLDNHVVNLNDKGQIKEFDGFVRFLVLNETSFEEEDERTYLNQSIYSSFIDFYKETLDMSTVDLSFMSCEVQADSKFATKKIRHPGDNTKLISFNDTENFTYRGIFPDKNAAMFVGYEDMQKSHSALRWLIQNVGFQIGKTTIVVWENNGIKIPDLFMSADMIEGYEELFQINEECVFLNEAYSNALKKMSNGYNQSLPNNSEVIILGLTSFTDKGRLSISLYEKSSTSSYVDRVVDWQKSLIWPKKSTINKQNYTLSFPSIKEIAKLVCGKKENEDKNLKKQMLRLVNCILYGNSFPSDLMKIIVDKISRPVSNEKEEYEEMLFVACSVINKYWNDKKKGIIKMSLDRTNTDRNYLYVRLLGAAQKIEEIALYKKGKKPRTTNAENLMGAFQKNPSRTWMTIRERIIPYISYLKENSNGYYLKELTEIYDMIENMKDFISNKPLNEMYLIGYYHEMNNYKKKEEENKNEQIGE